MRSSIWSRAVLRRFAALAVAAATLIAVAPAADAATWRKVGKVNGPTGVNALSCPAADLCVAAGYSSVSVTKNPAGSASGWKKQTIATRDDPTGNSAMIAAVGCVSAAACVLGDDGQNGYFSASPQAGPWAPFAFPSNTYVTIKAIGCAPQGNCTALGVDNHALSTPTLGAGSIWSYVALPGTTSSNYNTDVSAVTCPSTTCVLTQSGTSVHVTTDAGVTWSAVKLPGAKRIAKVDCPSATFCIAGGYGSSKGPVWISRNPTQSSSWKAIKAFPKTADATAVGCASTSRCFAAVGGTLYSSSSPAKASAWKRDKANKVWTGVVSMIECPTAKLCVAGDQFGAIGVAKL